MTDEIPQNFKQNVSNTHKRTIFSAMDAARGGKRNLFKSKNNEADEHGGW